jgi:hypothetical protein
VWCRFSFGRSDFSRAGIVFRRNYTKLGTPSSANLGRSCPSRDATGQQSVTQSEDWYNKLHPFILGWTACPVPFQQPS